MHRVEGDRDVCGRFGVARFVAVPPSRELFRKGVLVDVQDTARRLSDRAAQFRERRNGTGMVGEVALLQAIDLATNEFDEIRFQIRGSQCAGSGCRHAVLLSDCRASWGTLENALRRSRSHHARAWIEVINLSLLSFRPVHAAGGAEATMSSAS